MKSLNEVLTNNEQVLQQLLISTNTNTIDVWSIKTNYTKIK